MIGRILIGILALFLFIGPFSTPITDGIHNWRASDTTEADVLTTGAAATTANFTLSHDLYQASVAEIISITSSNATETPVASSYDEDNYYILLSSLDPANNRTITVNYYAETDDTVMRVLGPFLAILIFGSIVGAILWGIWGGGKKKSW